MWWLLWLLIGIAIGAAIVWAMIKRRVEEEIAATGASYESRLAHLQGEVGRADQAHEETKGTLHELLADRNAAKERAQRLEEEAATARRLAAGAQAQEAKVSAELGEVRGEIERLKAELDGCRRRGGELETRAASAQALAAELEARIRDMQAVAPAQAGHAPPAPSPAAGDGEEAAARLKAIETKLAELPVGVTAHTALKQERDELLRLTGGDLPLPGMPPETSEPVPAATAMPRPPVDGRAQRLRAIEAKLKMLPAGSSARATLLAEKARLVETGDAAPSLPTAPVGVSHDDLEIIKGIGPVINRELIAMGIVTFAQLVALTPAQIDYIEDKIGFPGRVAREHWIEQARELMAGGTSG
ncbi:MAG TPA: hypothetical protein PKA13_10470 [Geminicoccaceae bacterium]|nr:hypothetical protein [Geminicoccus sp.]HMU50190.1 hypothetical protein [Geminicoccaceae bacterium]